MTVLYHGNDYTIQNEYTPCILCWLNVLSFEHLFGAFLVPLYFMFQVQKVKIKKNVSFLNN